MEIDFTTLLGFIAAGCTTIAFFPQVLKVWKTHCTTDISLITFVILSSGVFLWLIYGLLIRDLPIVFANSVSFVFITTILIFKARYR